MNANENARADEKVSVWGGEFSLSGVISTNLRSNEFRHSTKAKEIVL